jgi:quercetin dioxygenase-like cupin family protein
MLKLDLDRVELADNATAGGPIRVAFPFHSAAGASASAAVLFELDSGDELATHTDSAEEVLLVLAGDAEAEVGERRVRLSAGELAVVPALEPHSVRNAGEGTLRVLGFFSQSTVVATFAEPLVPEGPQVMVIGAPVQLAVPLDGDGASL